MAINLLVLLIVDLSKTISLLFDQSLNGIIRIDITNAANVFGFILMNISLFVPHSVRNRFVVRNERHGAHNLCGTFVAILHTIHR